MSTIKKQPPPSSSSSSPSSSSPPLPSLTTFLPPTPPPNCTSHPIDFSLTPLREHSTSFALLIHHLLTPTECVQLLHLAQSTTDPPSTWSAAEINVGQGRQQLMLEARNCGRIIWDSATVAERLMARIMPFLPEEIVTLDTRGQDQNEKQRRAVGVTGWHRARRGEVWRVSRLNERLRFLKYTQGMYFKEHCDGSYATPGGEEVSFLTVHVYLNGRAEGEEEERRSGGVEDGEVTGQEEGDVENQPLQGGSTRFSSLSGTDKYFDVNPEVGACLVFQHRGLLHSGEEVEQGVKYTVRSDVMYERLGADGKGQVTGR